MKNKKTVILFGAGACLPWNSPTTSELTDLVRRSGFKTFSNIYITEFIYQKLLASGYKEADINFETIINVIEEMIVYYSHFNNENKTPSLLNCFFTPIFEDEIFNFSIKGGVEKHGYELDIPKEVNYPFSKHSYYNETPKQFFLQHLIAELISSINGKISSYAYHTPGNSVIDIETDESKLFIKWMKSLIRSSSLRLYTLNYDRVFKILLERSGIGIFEGFDCGEYIDYSAWLRADIPKILSDSDSNIYYNLHGSAFWRVEAVDSKQLPNPELFLTASPVLTVNHNHATLQMEKGKTIMITNIITGYQKAQKTLVTPLKQMQASFDKDCCFANDIFIIGYSLSDEHINETIKTAIRHNPKVKITIVDPYFLKNGLDYQLAIKIFPFKNDGEVQPTSVDKDLHIFYNEVFKLHTIEFKEFLKLVR